MMNGTGLVFVVGGARSGKSSFAQEMATALEGRVVFIATATAGDREMERRIAVHRSSRPASWKTVEEPLDSVAAIRSCRSETDVVLVDCLTFFLANLVFRKVGEAGEEVDLALAREVERFAMDAITQVIQAAREIPALVILVANEVGQGVVPPTGLGRLFRNLAGRVNQSVAREADRVYLIHCGLATELKGSAVTAAEAAKSMAGFGSDAKG